MFPSNNNSNQPLCKGLKIIQAERDESKERINNYTNQGKRD